MWDDKCMTIFLLNKFYIGKNPIIGKKYRQIT